MKKSKLTLQEAPYLDAELSFLEALTEPQFSFGDNTYFTMEEILAIGTNVKAYYESRADVSQPCVLRNGDVVPRIQQTDYWLVENDNTFIGQISLRALELPQHLLEMGGHIGYSIRPTMRGKGYATAMLQLLLQKLDKSAYPHVLITCNEANKASAKVIEKNGGILQDVIDTKYNPDSKMCRYHITL